MSAKPSPLPGYVALSQQVLLYEPIPEEKPSPSDPNLVILYGWGDAVPKHIAKYADHYAEIYPSTGVAIVLCPMSGTVFANLETRTERMMPVAKLVNEYMKDNRKNILVQCMSGAGAVNYASTLNSYRLLYGTPMPHKMLVLDSSPGTAGMNPGNIRRWSRALAIGTGKRLPWPLFITQIFWATFITLYALHEKIIGRENSGAWSHRTMNDVRFVPMNVRLYIYSREDPLMSWEGIEAHAKLASDIGWQVGREVFSHTSHVSHMKKYTQDSTGVLFRLPGIYWRRVRLVTCKLAFSFVYMDFRGADYGYF